MKYQENIIKPLVITFFLIGSFAAITGCTKAMRVHESDWNKTSKWDEGFTWDQSEEIYEGDYTIYTVDGRELKGSKLGKTDSTITIYETYRVNESIPSDSIVLHIDEIEYVEKTEIWWVPTIIITNACAVVVTVFIILGKGLQNLD